ncbi:MAG: HDIG domain-containing metalloprotein [Bacillota bacterium]
MTRQEALELMQKNVANINLQKHCLAVEAVMRALARHFGVGEEAWGLAGLLHDIDYDQTKDDPDRHSLVGGKMLEDLGVAPEIVKAVKAHNDRHGLPRETLMEKALYCTDPVTGLVVAGALILPAKKLAALNVEFLMNRFHEKSFARGARRDTIQTCSELGLSLEKFLDISLEAMQGISDELGM